MSEGLVLRLCFSILRAASSKHPELVEGRPQLFKETTFFDDLSEKIKAVNAPFALSLMKAQTDVGLM